LIEIFFIKIELHYNLVIKKNYPIRYVDKQIFKTILSLNIFSEQSANIFMYSKKMGFLLKKKFQKFKYFYGFFTRI